MLDRDLNPTKGVGEIGYFLVKENSERSEANIQ